MEREKATGMSGAARSELLGHLRAARPGVEEAIFARASTVAGPLDLADADRVAGLRAAIGAGFDLALDAIERRGEAAPSFPPALTAIARRAARDGISLDSLLRRCVAAEILVREFVLEESERWGRGAVREARMRWGSLFDRLMETMSREYERELEHTERTPARKRLRLIRRLLAGEAADAGELGYELERWHVGLIASGSGTPRIAERIERGLGCATLAICLEEGATWIWLGTRRPPNRRELESALQPACAPGVALALGEPSRGTAGWRQTHRQARAARWVALAQPGRVTRYAEHALLSAALRDDVLAGTLRDAYLAPLAGERGGGEVARATLRAYFGAGCNAATAAAALGVDRHTVQRRLRRLEARLGRPLANARPELEVALALDAVERTASVAPGERARSFAAPVATGAAVGDGPGTVRAQVRRGGAAGSPPRSTLAQHGAS